MPSFGHSMQGLLLKEKKRNPVTNTTIAGIRSELLNTTPQRDFNEAEELRSGTHATNQDTVSKDF